MYLDLIPGGSYASLLIVGKSTSIGNMPMCFTDQTAFSTFSDWLLESANLRKSHILSAVAKMLGKPHHICSEPRVRIWAVAYCGYSKQIMQVPSVRGLLWTVFFRNEPVPKYEPLALSKYEPHIARYCFPHYCLKASGEQYKVLVLAFLTTRNNEGILVCNTIVLHT